MEPIAKPIKRRQTKASKPDPLVVPSLDVVTPAMVNAAVDETIAAVVAASATMVDEPVATPATPRKPRTKLVDELAKLVDMNQKLRTLLQDKTLDATYKSVLTQCSKQIKQCEMCAKKDLKPKPVYAKRTATQSGITKPVPVTLEMSTFAGWAPEEPHSRVEISKAILQYVREHNLQNPARRREIQPDTVLTALLKYDPIIDGTLEYVTVQKLLSRVIASN